MKKIILSLISLVLVLSLTSCGGISKQKKQQITDTMAAYEEAVFSVGKQIEVLVDYNGVLEDFDDVYSYFDGKYMELVNVKQQLKAEYDANVDDFTEETADAFIASYDEPMVTAQNYHTEICDYIKQLEEN